MYGCELCCLHKVEINQADWNLGENSSLQGIATKMAAEFLVH